jgi:hypothetical protein
LTWLACSIAIFQSGCTRSPDLEAKSSEYKKGYAVGVQDAKAEINESRMTFYTYGLRYVPRDGKDIHQDTGLPYQPIAGCMVFDDIRGRAAGHNKTILEYLDRTNP